MWTRWASYHISTLLVLEPAYSWGFVRYRISILFDPGEITLRFCPLFFSPRPDTPYLGTLYIARKA